MDDKNQIMEDNTQKSLILENTPEKENNEKSKLWSFLFLLCLLAIVGLFTYFIIFELNPKKLTLHAISNTTKELRTLIEPININYNINNDKILLNNKLTFKLNSTSLDELKKIVDNTEINTNIMYDRNNKKMFTDLNTKIDDINFSSNLFIDDKKVYILLHDIYEKYIKINDISYDLFKTNISRENLEYIYNLAINSLVNNLDDSLFTKKLVFEKDISAISELNISKLQATTIANNVKNEVLSDSTVQEILSIYYNEEEYNKIKNNALDSTSIYFDNISIRVNQSIIKEEIKSIEFISKTNGIEYKLLIQKDKEKTNIITYTNNEEKDRYIININNKNFNLEYKNINNSSNYTLKGIQEDDYYNYIFNYPGQTKEQDVNITLKLNYNIGNNLAYNAQLGIKVQDIDVIIELVGNIGPLSSDINVDTSNFTPIENVDMNNINEKLEQKFMPLIKKISSIFEYNTLSTKDA